MRPKDNQLSIEVKQKLEDFSFHIAMPGIDNTNNLSCLVAQLVDSVRRVEYVKKIVQKSSSKNLADPSMPCFNPLKAAIWHQSQGNTEEAFWLVFLFVHFGKHHVTGWNLVKSIYGGLSSSRIWNWDTITNHQVQFRVWLAHNQEEIINTGRFGNHRKYETVDLNKSKNTTIVIESYIEWIHQHNDHQGMIQNAKSIVDNDPKALFNYLYKSMNDVVRFGRTAKFDYLTMLGKIKLVDIEPNSAYLKDATGPLKGAKLLFGGSINAEISHRQLENNLRELEGYLDLYFGWQVLEDALCNWQKNPIVYEYFRG